MNVFDQPVYFHPFHDASQKIMRGAIQGQLKDCATFAAVMRITSRHGTAFELQKETHDQWFVGQAIWDEKEELLVLYERHGPMTMAKEAVERWEKQFREEYEEINMPSPKLWVTPITVEGHYSESSTELQHYGDYTEATEHAREEAQKFVQLGDTREATDEEYREYYVNERVDAARVDQEKKDRHKLNLLHVLAREAVDYVGSANYAHRARYAKRLLDFFMRHERAPNEAEREQLNGGETP